MTNYCPDCGGRVLTVRDGPTTTVEERCMDCSWGRSP